MKLQKIYELGDQVKVVAVPRETFGSDYSRLLGKVLTVVREVDGYRWVDDQSVQIKQLNDEDTSDFRFEIYEPPIMQNSEFRIGQVVKCVANYSTYGLLFEPGKLYTVGTDCYGDVGPLDECGYTLRPDENKTTFILVSQEPLSASDPELDAAKARIAELEALVQQKNQEINDLRNAIGRTQDILSAV